MVLGGEARVGQSWVMIDKMQVLGEGSCVCCARYRRERRLGGTHLPLVGMGKRTIPLLVIAWAWECSM